MMNTSLISILSSTHGRLRREQRDIDKRDLQRALKHGKYERAWGKRWKVEYDGITFITDSSMRREITAHPSPLPDAPLVANDHVDHKKAIELLDKKPELATSHTVIVLDNSGSMLAKKNNIYLYRDSQNAAVSMTALEFIAEQLFNKTATNSDLVSLVTFRSTASTALAREPIDWVVYNKILKHRNCDRFTQRKDAPALDEILGQSNYLPALDRASELLATGYHEKCAVSLFFLSDGSFTDHQKGGISSGMAKQRMSTKVKEMANQFGENFTITTVGLGEKWDDFSALQEMATAASSAGSKGSFEYCNKTANAMTSAISSLVTTTTETRTSIHEGRRQGYTQRKDLKSEAEASVQHDWQYFHIAGHHVYNPGVNGFLPSWRLPLAAVQSNPVEAEDRSFSPPPFLAINRNYIGKGAERVAYRCRLSDKASVDGFVFDTMVAKETKDIERMEEKIDFHRGFVETQDLANYLASEFNRHVRALPQYHPRTTPQLVFLSCSVLTVQDPEWEAVGGIRGVLLEKMLDTKKFAWTKWNNNAGMVDGVFRPAPLDVDFELKQMAREQHKGGIAGLNLGAITEEDEEESDDDESLSDLEDEGDRAGSTHHQSHDTEAGIKPSDYLQAFTHFTYRYTNKRVMVCDLQGVFNTDMTPPTFELTDPALHYASAKGRRMVYGRTDKGKSGMNNFFRTHKCTKICRFLQLSAKNKKWNRDWRRDFEKRQQEFEKKTKL